MAKISEVIKYLKGIKKIHGDIDVFKFTASGFNTLDIQVEVDLDLSAVFGATPAIVEWETQGWVSIGRDVVPELPKRVIL